MLYDQRFGMSDNKWLFKAAQSIDQVHEQTFQQQHFGALGQESYGDLLAREL